MLGYLIVRTDRNGMSTHTAVNVLITCFGQGQFARKFLCVKEEEFLMQNTDVYALKESFGMEKDAHFLIV